VDAELATRPRSFLYTEVYMNVRQRLRSDDSGATMVEYGLLVAFVAIVALVGIKVIGSHLSTMFSAVATSV
jgi:pilus assembly protein Flp/PilA